MAPGVFNIAKGRVAELYRNVENNTPANSAFVIVLLKSAGLEADDTLNNHDDLAAILAAANDECDFTNYARKVLTDSDLAAVPAPDDTNNRVDLDIPDLTWTSAGGATNNTIGKLLICYDPDTTTGTDSTITPVTYHDFVYTTTGVDLPGQVAAAGFFRASHV